MDRTPGGPTADHGTIAATPAASSSSSGSEDDIASSGDENVVQPATLDGEPTGATILLSLVDRLEPVRRKPNKNGAGTDPKYSNEEEVEFLAPGNQNPAPSSPSGANPRSESPPPRDSSILPAFGIAI
eukprot:TRINITY_DN13316_c0_g1_i1.p1 TRINITY_DN13316_c0_g1~~TRINITY_DN13316_c0_g1_i1.p1  ORF type:complete len:128 (-),score=16.93 TRINITY_DN13316_c0_g1_i1:77-460(-)